jgi:hypothetical protein
MAGRFDKVQPEVGGFRAPLGANLVLTQTAGVVGVGLGPVGVSLDANGRVLVGGPNNSGLVGVIVKNMPSAPLIGNTALGTFVTAAPAGTLTGDIIDVMTAGEIVDVLPALVAGTNYFADGASGALTAGTGTGTNTAPATAGSKKVGFTVEANRLIVRFGAA